jgi:hypothetical protein
VSGTNPELAAVYLSHFEAELPAIAAVRPTVLISAGLRDVGSSHPRGATVRVAPAMVITSATCSWDCRR